MRDSTRNIGFFELSGLKIKPVRGKPTTGKVLDEGLIEYYSQLFAKDSLVPALREEREEIEELIPGVNWKSRLNSGPSDYSAARNLVEELIDQGGEKRAQLFLQSRFSAKGLKALIQNLKEAYGFDNVKKLFALPMDPYEISDMIDEVRRKKE